MKKRYLVPMLLALTITSAFLIYRTGSSTAQTPSLSASYSITGTVTSNSHPLAGVRIQSTGNFSTTTDTSGLFTISGLITGTYAVTPTKPGYTFSPAFRSINIPPNATGVDFTAIPPKNYIPIIWSPPAGITGQVTENGVPTAGIPLDLLLCNSTECTSVANTSTHENGTYLFKDPAPLVAGQGYQVRYLNGTADSTHLYSWYTGLITEFASDRMLNIGKFDIANLVLAKPDPASTVKIPHTFSWFTRQATTTDSYIFALFEPNASLPFYFTDPPLGYVNSYLLSSLPQGFVYAHQYGWTVFVSSPDGGMGAPYWYFQITFSKKVTSGLRYTEGQVQGLRRAGDHVDALTHITGIGGHLKEK